MDISDNNLSCELLVEDISADSEKINQWLFDLQNEIAATNMVSILPAKTKPAPIGSKAVDPVLAAVCFSMLSNSLPQILNFLHDWALRREGRVLKIKIQSKKDKVIEMEIPTSLSNKEVKAWIKSVQSAIK